MTTLAVLTYNTLFAGRDGRARPPKTVAKKESGND
jgi:hypothetical protein